MNVRIQRLDRRTCVHLPGVGHRSEGSGARRESRNQWRPCHVFAEAATIGVAVTRYAGDVAGRPRTELHAAPQQQAAAPAPASVKVL